MGKDQTYDAIVIGVGGMGSATLCHLAQRGQRVLGLEQFDIPHHLGSSHGVNRIIRLAYFEHPTYVPLLKRSYELWRRLQDDVGEQLLYITGSLDIGRPGSQVYEGAIRSTEAHGLPHERLDAREVRERFPGIALPRDFRAVLQPDGGFVMSERGVVSHVREAIRQGAEVHGREPVRRWHARDDRIEVQTDRSTYRSRNLVITAGPWVGHVVPGLRAHAIAERQVVGWFQPRNPALFAPDRLPVFNFTSDEGHFYGFPEFGVPGFKIGRYHHLEERVDPDAVNREPTHADETVLRQFVDRYFPDASGPTLSLSVCLFTNTDDEHFIIDRHPAHDNVWIAGGFSGHGYKFAPVIGEIVAELATTGTCAFDLRKFAIDRFSS